jgi:membrane protein DedA with SNARE-associated domain
MQEMLSFMLNFGGLMPYLLVFGILLACGLGIPIPEDITLFVGGMLAYYGIVNVWCMILVCMAGVLVGDSTIFFLGAKYGRRLTDKPFFHKFLSPERLEIVKGKFHEKGNKVIFAARFMPGLRAPTYFSAGTLHLPFRVFFFYDGLAALISVPAIVWVVYHFGALANKVIGIIRDVEHGIIAAVVAVILIVIAKWYYNQRKQKPIGHTDVSLEKKAIHKKRYKKRYKSYTKHHH